MAIGLNPDKERIYVLEDDRELAEDQRTRWVYKLLSYPAYMSAQDNLVQFQSQKVARGQDSETRTLVLSGTQEKNTLINGLIRVENFFDEDGQLLHYPEAGTEAKVQWLSKVKPRWRAELAKAILGESDLEEADRKKLPSPSGSPALG